VESSSGNKHSSLLLKSVSRTIKLLRNWSELSRVIKVRLFVAKNGETDDWDEDGDD
jgi:hypothetical protein